MATGEPQSVDVQAKEQEAHDSGKITPPPSYTEQPPVYRTASLMPNGTWMVQEQPYVYGVAHQGYTSLPVVAGVTADDAMLIPEGIENIEITRERESFVMHIVLSCFVFWLFCWPLGLTAFILAMLAQSRSKIPGDVSAGEAKKLGGQSIRASIAGIIIGIVFITSYVVYVFVINKH